MNIDRSTVHKPALKIALLLLVVGFSGLLGPKATGLCKGFGAVFFIVFMIFNYLKNEKMDDELGGGKSARH